MSAEEMAGENTTERKEMRPYKVYAIEDGVVIDHIPAKKAFDVVNVLRAMEGDSLVTLGINLESRQMGRKDVVKIEKKGLSRHELMRISLIAPNATINIIKNHEVKEKLRIEVPSLFEGVVKCPNPGCITRHEPVETKFHTLGREPFRLRCHFCERVFEREEIGLL